MLGDGTCTRLLSVTNDGASAAAGQRRAVWWVLWQPQSNPVARRFGPGRRRSDWETWTRPYTLACFPFHPLRLSEGEHRVALPASGSAEVMEMLLRIFLKSPVGVLPDMFGGEWDMMHEGLRRVAALGY